MPKLYGDRNCVLTRQNARQARVALEKKQAMMKGILDGQRLTSEASASALRRQRPRVDEMTADALVWTMDDD